MQGRINFNLFSKKNMFSNAKTVSELDAAYDKKRADLITLPPSVTAIDKLQAVVKDYKSRLSSLQSSGGDRDRLSSDRLPLLGRQRGNGGSGRV